VKSMTFVWPWTFLAFLPVAAAALLALFRPRRNLVVVGALALWQEAVETAASASRRKSRWINASWVLLLAGAVAAVFAASRPVHYSSPPVRQVAVALHPAAELGRGGNERMCQAADRLLGRLDASDRVQLLLPDILGGAGPWTSVAKARRRAAGLMRLPVPGAGLRVGRADSEAQHVYHLTAGGEAIPVGPGVSRIVIPANLPTLTIDAVAAKDVGGGKIQVFVALRNQSDRPAGGNLAIRAVPDNPAGDALKAVHVSDAIGPRQRRVVVMPVDAAAAAENALKVTIRPDDGPAAVAFLARRETVRRTVAIVGRDDPYLRRFVKVDPTLRLIAEPALADVVIANGSAAPAGKPALVIAPPSPPAPWRLARDELTSLMLADADPAPDDEIMKGVDLAGAAVRRVAPWVRGELPGGKVLIGYKRMALAVRSADDAAAASPRRVYVAFDLSEENCTLVRTESYVVFLANVMRYLSPGLRGEAKYEYLTPLEAGMNPAWVLLASDEESPYDPGALNSAGLTAPGVFRDAAGKYHAVSLVALRSSRADSGAIQTAESAPLPDPQPLARGTELWSILLAVAAALWLAGWTLRTLRD